jgi:FMN-dependent NADH-azoreductase
MTIVSQKSTVHAMKLLHIDSSILSSNSVSRGLTAEIVAAEQALHSSLSITYRDLSANPLQHLSGAHLAVAQGAPEIEGIDTAQGSAALEEFLAADIVVIGAPMYNFSIPSQLKAWIDRISVAGKTFTYSANGVEGLAGGKKVIIASSRGGAYLGTPMAALDHQESYLQSVFSFFGISDITFIRAENVARTELREPAIEAARAQIANLAA